MGSLATEALITTTLMLQKPIVYAKNVQLRICVVIII